MKLSGIQINDQLFRKTGEIIKKGKYRLLLIIFSFFISSIAFSQSSSPLPFFSQQGTAMQFIVDGAPFFMRGGELGNSTASDMDYLKPYWPLFKEMNINTILCPVYWELIEPSEGKFDFSLLDNTIKSARQHNIRLVLLWFGTWKNSMSCYAPLWVKADQKRFPRARDNNGSAQEILTPFDANNLHSDIKAFTALMHHIKSIDTQQQTVIMVQVENEIGMIPSARDYSKAATKAFNDNVPSELLNYIKKNKNNLTPELSKAWQANGSKTNGNWQQVFGEGLTTDEFFMAWYYAKFTDAVTQAGKKVYNLPMYVNAALIRPGRKPGQYPSAGPLPHLYDIWHAGAPNLDFIAPDIYFRSFAEWVGKYDIPGNPVFIPEVGNGQSAANAFYAIGRHNAIGYSPFSIESITGNENNLTGNAYNLLYQLDSLILAHQGMGTMNAVLLDSASHTDQITLGKYKFNFKHEYSWPYAFKTSGENPRFGGLIIMLGPDEYIIAGSGLVVTFETAIDDGSIAGIGSLDEMQIIDGKPVYGRRMNGDQSHQGRHMHIPGQSFSMQKVVLYQYK